MKKFEITKEQILELANESSFTKATLNKMFPQAFQSELEVGKWYKGYVDFKSLIYITGLEDKKSYTTIKYYGFTFGDYSESGTIANYEHEKSLVPATDKEVETALIAEAKRRGFNGENCIKWSFYNLNYSISYPIFSSFEFENNTLYFAKGIVFEDGKWAEIISEPIEVTLEEIAEKFNVNVEQLKIKK